VEREIAGKVGAVSVSIRRSNVTKRRLEPKVHLAATCAAGMQLDVNGLLDEVTFGDRSLPLVALFGRTG